VVVHVLPSEPSSQGPVVVGFVVSKAVGGAVVRNRTKRRLSALVRPLLPGLAPGTRVVVRAQPAAAPAPTSVLGQDLTRALHRAGALTSTERP
jgi:ribonuclease P protein component